MEVQKPPPGYEWLNQERVEKYLGDQEGDALRDEIERAHGRMMELLGLPRDAAFRFMDLGAGAGAVSASVMSAFPNATGVLADMSAPMMEAGSSKLTPFEGRYRYVEVDMNSDDWPSDLSGPFQAVVSARAIHHLTSERKAALFGRVHDALAPGGVFINWDNMKRPDEEKVTNREKVPAYLALLEGARFVNNESIFVEGVGHRWIMVGRKPS